MITRPSLFVKFTGWNEKRQRLKRCDRFHGNSSQSLCDWEINKLLWKQMHREVTCWLMCFGHFGDTHSALMVISSLLTWQTSHGWKPDLWCHIQNIRCLLQLAKCRVTAVGWMEEKWMVNFCAAAEVRLNSFTSALVNILYVTVGHLDFLSVYIWPNWPGCTLKLNKWMVTDFYKSSSSYCS